jgi:hypothetical protein
MGISKSAAIVSHITDTVYRLDLVVHDPAVVKASKRAWSDTKQAATSIGVLANETNSAWRRTRSADRI